MNFLTIVQKAMTRASVREDSPTTLVGATGIVADFAEYVNDTYRNIQACDHGERWFFRQSLDQTLAMVASQSTYTMPTGLADLNWRTVTCYETTAKEEETPVVYMDYYVWRSRYNTVDTAEGKPQYIILKPDGDLEVVPTPDTTYTIHYDGVLAIDELSADADLPIIPDRNQWQWALVWGAVKRWAMAHEDGALLAKADAEYRPIYDSLVNWQLPDVRIKFGNLSGRISND